MNKSLLVIIALLAAFSTTVQSASDGKKSISLLNALNLPNNFENGLDAIKNLINNYEGTESSAVPQVSDENFQLFAEWLALNIKFVVNKSDLDDATKKVILDIVPKILKAKSLEEIQVILEPVILTGLGLFFQDPFIIFSPRPYFEATKRILQQFFDSPEAPEFLKDPAQQQVIIEYVDKLFATNDPSSALAILGMDLFVYLNSASGQELKPLIQQFIPELYVLIENETEITVIYDIIYSYAVTQVVSIYNMVLNFFGSDSVQNTMQIIKSMAQISQKIISQKRR